MTVEELRAKVDALKTETHDALQAVYDELNPGQQKKILKNEQIKILFERYGVI